MITKKEIAEKLGVSRTTVSLVLNRKPDARISEQTRKRVLKAAKELGYRPEEGQELPDLICYILCNRKLDVPHYYEQLKKLERIASERGLRIIFITVDHDQSEYTKMVNILKSTGVKGAVLAGDFNQEIVQRIQQIPLPFVASGVTNIEGINVVAPDHFNAGFDATNHLLELGHKRIAFFTGELYKLTHSKILAGYRRAYETRDLKFDPALVQISHAERGDDLVQRMKELGIDYTAILAVNEKMGVDALNELKMEGKDIPNDVSIIAIGGDRSGLHCRPKLSTVVAQEGASAKLILDTLEQNINNYNMKPKKIVVQCTIIHRESTSPYSG